MHTPPGMIPDTLFSVYAIGHENLRPWEPIIPLDIWPTAQTLPEPNSNLKKIVTKIYAACPPDSPGFVANGTGSGFLPTSSLFDSRPRFPCPKELFPGHHCHFLSETTTYPTDADGAPLALKHGPVEKIGDEGKINILNKITAPVNFYVQYCLNNVIPPEGEEMFFAFDIIALEPESAWAAYDVIIDPTQVSNPAFDATMRFADVGQIAPNSSYITGLWDHPAIPFVYVVFPRALLTSTSALTLYCVVSCHHDTVLDSCVLQKCGRLVQGVWSCRVV